PAGAEVLHHDVAVGGEAPHDGPALLVAQVDRDRLLVPGDRRPPQAVAADGDSPAPHGIATTGLLDLHNLGPVVAEQLPGERSGHEAAELEHPYPGQRTLLFSHPTQHARAAGRSQIERSRSTSVLVPGPMRSSRSARYRASSRVAWCRRICRACVG